MYRGWTQTDYQIKYYNMNQEDEGTQDDRGRDGRTNFILRIKEQETHLTVQEHDDDDTLQGSNMLSSHFSDSRKSFICSVFNPVILFIHFGRYLRGDIPEILITNPYNNSLPANLDPLHTFCIICASIICTIFLDQVSD